MMYMLGRWYCAELAGKRAIHAGPAEPYRLQFFRPDENELLDALMEMIIPADAHSPGARAAKVSLFADWMVSHDSAATQREWRDGLRRMNEEARKTSRADALANAAAGLEVERFGVEGQHEVLRAGNDCRDADGVPG